MEEREWREGESVGVGVFGEEGRGWGEVEEGGVHGGVELPDKKGLDKYLIFWLEKGDREYWC